MRNKIMLAVVFLSLLGAGFAWADAPKLINFQGRLTDSLGNAVSDGVYSLRFRIYDDSLAGNVLWEETTSVQIKSGLFTVLLGSTSAVPESSFYSANRWLGIKVGSNPEIAPRQRLASVGYSFQSGQWSSSGNDIYRDSGNVGVGAVPPADVRLYAYDLRNDPNSSGGVAGQAQNTSSGNAYGVSGYANANSGNAYGGYFSGNSSSGASYGVYGTSSAGRGVYGSGALAGGDFEGTSGGSAGVTGQGVVAGVTGTGGTYGVYGTSTSGTGVRGGGYTGVSGFTSLAGGTGLLASANVSNGIGLFATANAAGGYGVQAVGGSYGVYGGGGTYGVYGTSSVSSGYGVFGSNGGNSATWAGYFQGDSRVTGNLSVDGFIFKNGGGFKIDHPLDPANKYLYHSFVESPDMKNIYDGVVTIDAKGEAIITLPDWFGAVNKDFRYQLTALGAPGPNLYISQEVSGNQFKIAGGTPGMKVSWQVTGIRQDAYAKAHRIPVEEEKPAQERGKYIHPKEEGVSETLGMNYEMTQKMEAERKQQEEQRVKMEQEGLSPKK